MVVSEDKKEAIVGWYRVLNGVNMPYTRTKLMGLSPDTEYRVEGMDTTHFGDELMNYGLITSDHASGSAFPG